MVMEPPAVEWRHWGHHNHSPAQCGGQEFIYGVVWCTAHCFLLSFHSDFIDTSWWLDLTFSSVESRKRACYCHLRIPTDINNNVALRYSTEWTYSIRVWSTNNIANWIVTIVMIIHCIHLPSYKKDWNIPKRTLGEFFEKCGCQR